MRLKTFLYTVSLMLAIILISHLLIYYLMPVFYDKQQKLSLDTKTDEVIESLRYIYDDAQIEMTLASFALENRGDVYLQSGEHLYSIEALQAGISSLEELDGVEVLSGTFITIIDDLGEAIVLTSYADSRDKYYYISREFTGGRITAVFSRERIDEAVGVILNILPITAAICALLSVLFALFYSGILTRPIKQMSRVTERMRDLELGAACEVYTKDEMETLGDNINELYGNLLSTIKSLEEEVEKVAQNEMAKANFLRAASHELKTPITAINAMLENMILNIGKYKDHELYIKKCRDMITQLSQMIQDMLDATKIQDTETPELVSAADILTRLISPHKFIAKTRGIYFDSDLFEDFTFFVPIKLFEQAISNILANAVNYTHEGGSVLVYLEDGSIVIENECTPIPTEHLGQIFEPFYRPDYSRDRNTGGNGLGLYIVSSIFRLLDIEYSFLPAHSPPGMKFTVYMK